MSLYWEQREDISNTVEIVLGTDGTFVREESRGFSYSERTISEFPPVCKIRYELGGRADDHTRLETAFSLPSHLLDSWQKTINSASILPYTKFTLVNEDRLRNYSNSERLSYKIHEMWCDIRVEMYYNNHIIMISEGANSLDRVSSQLTSIIEELKIERRMLDLLPLRFPVPLQPSLLLTPTVSAILFHELFGHGCEETTQSELPIKVGPADMFVTTSLNAKRVFDDEGIRVKETRIVDSGFFTRKITDRVTALTEGGILSGVAQVGSHGKTPRGRCNYLKVIGGEIDAKDLLSGLKEGILCYGASSAEYIDGIAVVNVSRAVWIENGEHVSRLPPFTIKICLQDLHLHLAVLANNSQIGRSARCVKFGDSLPTVNQAPTVLLTDIEVWV